MPEHTAVSSDLVVQYTAQITNDLERNTKEQERINAEITALQQQLSELQRDHGVLLNVHQALGLQPLRVHTAPAVIEDAGVPSPRKKPAATQGGATIGPAAKTAKAQSGGKAGTPTLVELVRRHLSEQSEPRSAAEITTELNQAHPERGIKTTVVRTTLEGLVARGAAQRTKQGTSVFYTAPDAATSPVATPSDEPQPESVDN